MRDIAAKLLFDCSRFSKATNFCLASLVLSNTQSDLASPETVVQLTIDIILYYTSCEGKVASV